MKERILILFLLVFSLTYSWGEFIQEDLRVAINKNSGSKVYFKSMGGDLYLEGREDGLLRVYRIPKGNIEDIELLKGTLEYRGRKLDKINLYMGDTGSKIELSIDGKTFHSYRGDMEFIEHKGRVMPVNSIESEEYLYSVVPSEIGTYFPEEAIKAQVLAARTYLYYNLENYKYEGFDLLDNVNSQMYLGSNREHEKINKLVDSTVGEIISYDNKAINALYFSTSGGRTANNEDVWGGKAVAYLRGKRDTADESKAPRRSWSKTISKKELSSKVGFSVKSIKIIKKVSNRAHTVKLVGNGKSKTMSGDDLRRIVGYSKIFSTQFKVKDQGSSFRFDGRGAGHGVGMSQHGAYGLANKGKNYRQIIKHYYTGVQIKKLKND